MLGRGGVPRNRTGWPPLSARFRVIATLSGLILGTVDGSGPRQGAANSSCAQIDLSPVPCVPAQHTPQRRAKLPTRDQRSLHAGLCGLPAWSRTKLNRLRRPMPASGRTGRSRASAREGDRTLLAGSTIRSLHQMRTRAAWVAVAWLPVTPSRRANARQPKVEKAARPRRACLFSSHELSNTKAHECADRLRPV